MVKTIKLKIPKKLCDVYLAINIPREMEASELLKTIGANELAEFDIHPGHKKINNSYRDSGELKERTMYNIHTNDIDKTLDLIKNYNNKN